MSTSERVTLRALREKAQAGEKISVLSLYDVVSAGLAEQAGIDAIIVGDSVAQQIYGYPNTLQADMDMMVRHTQAVRRGAPNVFLIADMPYMSYQPSVELAVRNAGRFMAEGGADAVKFEGGKAISDKLEAVLSAGIPVAGHLGFLPQSAAMSGGITVQTRDAELAARLVDEAMLLDEMGVCLLILEALPAVVGEAVVKRVGVPVIGIGSGPACHGQVLLANDILGLSPDTPPRFVQQFADLSPAVIQAFKAYCDQIRAGEFPAGKHCYNMSPQQREKFLQLLAGTDREP